jgi:hypothetical protein
VTTDSSPRADEIRQRVRQALDAWPAPGARRDLLRLCSSPRLDDLEAAAYALARCGPSRREAADEFLERYESDRRLAPRIAVLYARAYLHDKSPRAFVRELNRQASLPGKKPWVPMMEEIYWMWARAPREMFSLMTPWLTHRDPRRRWAALHGLELPARRDPRSALKVLRLLRGERHLRVRRLLGHVLGQSVYPLHPSDGLEEMARWLSDGAAAAPSVSRQIEGQVAAWFASGMGTERQRKRLLRVCRDYAEHRDPDVRAHARRLARSLDGTVVA